MVVSTPLNNIINLKNKKHSKNTTFFFLTSFHGLGIGFVAGFLNTPFVRGVICNDWR